MSFLEAAGGKSQRKDDDAMRRLNFSIGRE
jgi:hypothetical protein